MIFKEEFKQSVDKLNSAINAVVAAAQRKPASKSLSLSVYSSSPCFDDRSVISINIITVAFSSINMHLFDVG